MLHLTVAVPTDLAEVVVSLLDAEASVTQLSVYKGGSVKPAGDVIEADVVREAANIIIERLRALGVPQVGTVRIEPVSTWLSASAHSAEAAAPGASADAVVWSETVSEAYAGAELNWTYFSFQVLATAIAAVGLINDSAILVVGAMVLGPEFGAISAIGVALVLRRPGLLTISVRTLLVGFAASIALTWIGARLLALLGWISAETLAAKRPQTAFVYNPDRWTLIVAVIAAAAGVLSLTSERLGGLTGVFISVTTIPAAANIAVGSAVGVWPQVRGSAVQLLVNIVAMIIAGWATLYLQKIVWSRVNLDRRGTFWSGRSKDAHRDLKAARVAHPQLTDRGRADPQTPKSPPL
ncbi:MAG: DUF389 domain-containing protein [Nostocoides sp.]